MAQDLVPPSMEKRFANTIRYLHRESEESYKTINNLATGLKASQSAIDRMLSFTGERFPKLTELLKNMRVSSEGRYVKKALQDLKKHEKNRKDALLEAKALAKQMKDLLDNNLRRQSDRTLREENRVLKAKLALMKFALVL